MKPCESFKCKEYKVTCNSCENMGCACNPVCERCLCYKKSCNGSGEDWITENKR